MLGVRVARIALSYKKHSTAFFVPRTAVSSALILVARKIPCCKRYVRTRFGLGPYFVHPI